MADFTRERREFRVGPEWVAAAVVSAALALGGGLVAYALPAPPSGSMVPGPSSAAVRQIAGWLAVGCQGATCVTFATAAYTGLRLATAPPGTAAGTARAVLPGCAAYLGIAAVVCGAAFAALQGWVGFVVILWLLVFPVLQWVFLAPGALFLARRPALVAGLQVPAAFVTGLAGLGYAAVWFTT